MVFKYLTMDENENIHTIHTETNKIIIKKETRKHLLKSKATTNRDRLLHIIRKRYQVIKRTNNVIMLNK